MKQALREKPIERKSEGCRFSRMEDARTGFEKYFGRSHSPLSPSTQFAMGRKRHFELHWVEFERSRVIQI